MLTLTDIKNITFRKASIGGYRSDEVDDFIDAVIASYEILLQESERQKEKLQSAMNKMEEYRGREENISAALMNAQRQADLVIREAEHRSEAMIQDAEQKAEHILAQAQIKIEKEEESVQTLRKEISSFKAKLMSIYKEHLLLIEALPGEEKDAPPQGQEQETDLQQKEASTPPENPEPNAEEVPSSSPDVDETSVLPEEPSAAEESVPPAEAPSAFFEASDFAAPSPQQEDLVSKPAEPSPAQEEEIHGFTVDLSAFEKITEEAPMEPVESQRFGALKFGDDYDINQDDDMKTPFAKFKRRK